MRKIILVIALIATSAAMSPAVAEQPGPRSFTIAAAGDVLIHGRVALIADRNSATGYDFEPMLMPIEPWIGEADFAICHLEGSLSPTNTGLAYYPRFIGPREVADAIAAAGYDVCSTSGNHAMDGGWSGVVGTLDLLDAAGVGHDGTARTEEERLPSLYDVRGITVAHASYSYGLNGIPNARPYAANIIDADLIISDARWAREHGSEFTVVSLHWGIENFVQPTNAQSTLAETLTASPYIDAILGSHAHVVQPVAWINDKPVVYGMGNHLSNQNSVYGDKYYATEDGVVVTLTVTEGDDGFAATAMQVTPTWVRLDDYAVLSVSDALATGAADPGLLKASWERTMGRLLSIDAAAATPTADPWHALTCQGMRATIVGTSGPDMLVGTDGDDVIAARGGNDFIISGAGNDVICAGDGDDRIESGDGWDLVWGDAGADLISGGSGRDRLDGGRDADSLWGGAGADAITGGEGAASDVISGGDGDDLLMAGEGQNRVFGGAGDDVMLTSWESANLSGGPGANSCRVRGIVVDCR